MYSLIISHGAWLSLLDHHNNEECNTATYGMALLTLFRREDGLHMTK